jgi:hypothetical protein
MYMKLLSDIIIYFLLLQLLIELKKLFAILMSLILTLTFTYTYIDIEIVLDDEYKIYNYY